MSIDNVIDEHFAFVSAEYNSGLMVRLTIDNGVRGLAALESLNRSLDKPFGELALGVRAMAFALSQLGYPIVRRDGDRLGAPIEAPMWDGRNVYQVLPKPEDLVLPLIDWSDVSPGFKWLAQCENGSAYFGKKEPYIASADHVAWSFPGTCAAAAPFASFKPGKGDWRKLRVQRPEGA